MKTRRIAAIFVMIIPGMLFLYLLLLEGAAHYESHVAMLVITFAWAFACVSLYWSIVRKDALQAREWCICLAIAVAFTIMGEIMWFIPVLSLKEINKQHRDREAAFQRADSPGLDQQEAPQVQ